MVAMLLLSIFITTMVLGELQVFGIVALLCLVYYVIRKEKA